MAAMKYKELVPITRQGQFGKKIREISGSRSISTFEEVKDRPQR